jgi:hypothetical protein
MSLGVPRIADAQSRDRLLLLNAFAIMRLILLGPQASTARGAIFRIYTTIRHFRPRVQSSVKNVGMAAAAGQPDGAEIRYLGILYQ